MNITKDLLVSPNKDLETVNITMEASRASETLADFYYQTPRRHTQYDNFQYSWWRFWNSFLLHGYAD